MSSVSSLATLPALGANRPLRVLFVSSTTEGGSGRSQRELNELLTDAGVDTMMLVDNEQGSMFGRFVHEHLWDASVKFRNTPVLGESAAWLRTLPGRRASSLNPSEDGTKVLLSPAPENALPDIAVTFRPDIVVGSSISRTTWRSIQATCETLHIPTALYMREAVAVGHLKPVKGHPFRRDDLLLANSQTLVTAAERVGARAHFVPSAVDLAPAAVESTRERILLINPRREHGVELVEVLAKHFRTIEFVLQESWNLTAAEQNHVDMILARHQNVIFRKRTDDRREVYRDAAIVLAPHQMDNRPRSILEALSNGIPVVASNLPGLRESVGPGGTIASTTGDWISAVDRLWKDSSYYLQVQHKAVSFANRAEVQPEHIVASFLTHVHEAIQRRRNRWMINLTTP